MITQLIIFEKMKKIILLAVVALMTSTSVLGQVEYPKNEVAVSYGALSNSNWMSVFEDIVTAPVDAMANWQKKNESYFGSLSVEYFHRMKPWLAVGGIFAYGQETADWYEGDVKKGDIKNTYLTLMPSVKFDWLRKEHFGMYSKLAAGATYRSEKSYGSTESKVHFNYQVSALGIEAGSLNLRGFVELGMGEQGVFLAGARYKF